MKPDSVPPAQASAGAAFQQALRLYRAGDIGGATALLRELAARFPDDAQVLFYLGTAELQSGNPAASADLLARSARQLANPTTYNNLGLALRRLAQDDRALAAFEQALRLDPGYADAHFNKGIALQARREFEAALLSYDNAIRCKPAFANAYSNRGAVLRELRRLDEALGSCEQAVALAPGSAEAQTNKGNVLIGLGRPADALPCYERAIELQPGNAEAYNNRAGALGGLHRLDDALRDYERAIELKPDYAEAHRNRGEMLRGLGRLDEALASYERASALSPGSDDWAAEWLYTKASVCDWSGVEASIEGLAAAVEAGGKATLPFATIILLDSPSLQKRAAQRWVADSFPAWRPASAGTAQRRPGRIRLAYLSADFHDHATMHLLAEMLERHDRSRFELFGISYGAQPEDRWRARARGSFEHFVDVGDRPDRQVAEFARGLGIDIAVDLKGFTKDARPGILAERCAPIQVSYLGYPGTTGAPFIDYVIADRTVIAEDARCHFTEKVAYLPHCYQANCRDRDVAGDAVKRRDCGLAEGAFVFCCFNGSVKILPPVFDSWMRILGRCHGSVLWLLESNRWAVANLRAEAERRGVAAERLVFAKPLPIDRHLGRLRLADLFLDTHPCNAHTTASDALRMGVPLLTRAGATFAGRVAASLLKTLGLDDLVTGSAEEYEQRAVELATAPGLLAAVKDRLGAAVAGSPLYDSTRFARDIEDLYERMHERHRRGLPPGHIDA